MRVAADRRAPAGRTRVLRVIARLNMGGPAIHVGLLSGRLDPQRYETLLVAGRLGPGEASLEAVAQTNGAHLAKIDSLGPEISPKSDARALRELAATVRRFRPDIIHTHTAKAGMLGRLAARLAGTRPPIVVHTYHGHVLDGYFTPPVSAFYRSVERGLGRLSDCLIGVSQATVDDLVRLRVAPPSKFRVIPVGVELDRFLRLGEDGGEGFRREVGVRDGEVLLTYVGRLAKIKRIDLMLAAVAGARRQGANVRLALVGDGELRSMLERLAQRLEIRDAVHFLGYRTDVDEVAAGADVALLTSDNEGTPVSLIEAAAAGRPAVATAVGGVPEVVGEGAGLLLPPQDVPGLADAIVTISGDDAARRSMGERAREHVRARFSSARLLGDVDVLYRELLRVRGYATASSPPGATPNSTASNSPM